MILLTQTYRLPTPIPQWHCTLTPSHCLQTSGTGIKIITPEPLASFQKSSSVFSLRLESFNVLYKGLSSFTNFAIVCLVNQIFREIEFCISPNLLIHSSACWPVPETCCELYHRLLWTFGNLQMQDYQKHWCKNAEETFFILIQLSPAFAFEVFIALFFLVGNILKRVYLSTVFDDQFSWWSISLRW
jgi:hypothetical protein